MGDLLDVGQQQQHIKASEVGKWFRQLASSVVFLDGCAKLEDLILVCAKHKVLSPFLGQLAWGASLRIERNIAACSLRKTTLGNVVFEWVEWHEALMDAQRRGKHLVVYVSNGRTAMSQSVVIGLCTDKASVGGLPLQNTVFLTPENVAVLACPTVRMNSL